MNEKYVPEIMAFIKMSDDEQRDILREYNSCESNQLNIFDIIPSNIEKDPKLKDFANFLILTKDRRDRKRKIIYIPIVHSEDDMGSLAEFVKKEYERKISRKQWQQHNITVKKLWVEIRDCVLDLNLNWGKSRIYQDGLPICGKELIITKELAGKGSFNHKLIIELHQKGAQIEGTEDSELLLADYNHIIMIARAKNLNERDKLIGKYSKVSAELLSKRDQFIADRIDKTLKKGETGILFLGLLHRANKLIEQKINVEYLNIGGSNE
ncbi:MAG: hypothetical protein K9L78_02340 [Victivallales bacterium]|nr:hypothetical protein [Victivallales bacterium]